MNKNAGFSSGVPAHAGAVRWCEPRILLCHTPNVHSEDSIRAYYAAIRRALDEGEGDYVMITDTRQMASIPDALARRLHGQLALETVRAHRRTCLRSITIVESPAVRAVLTAVRWVLGDSGIPSEVVSSLEEAQRIARKLP